MNSDRLAVGMPGDVINGLAVRRNRPKGASLCSTMVKLTVSFGLIVAILLTPSPTTAAAKKKKKKENHINRKAMLNYKNISCTHYYNSKSQSHRKI